jgi:hypothetical protein
MLNLVVSLASYYRLASPTLIPGGKVASGKSLLYGPVIISASLLELGSVKTPCGDLTSTTSCREIYFGTAERCFRALCDFCYYQDSYTNLIPQTSFLWKYSSLIPPKIKIQRDLNKTTPGIENPTRLLPLLQQSPRSGSAACPLDRLPIKVVSGVFECSCSGNL